MDGQCTLEEAKEWARERAQEEGEICYVVHQGFDYTPYTRTDLAEQEMTPEQFNRQGWSHALYGYYEIVTAFDPQGNEAVHIIGTTPVFAPVAANTA